MHFMVDKSTANILGVTKLFSVLDSQMHDTQA